MRFTVPFSLVLLASYVAAQDTSLQTVKAAFDAADIPSDLTVEFDPKFLLEVVLPPNQVTAGVQLPRNATAGPPAFSVCKESAQAKAATFVVAAVDPDAPTPQSPTSAQIRHFLGGNFHVGGDGKLTNSTPALSEWRQPTPPAGSDAHRYVFLLFKQSAAFNEQTLVNSTTPTSLFNISDFAEATGLGDPLAGTFILVAPETT